MPTDAETWKTIMTESGRMPDENGVWYYNPEAIRDPVGWVYKKDRKPCE